MTDARLAMIREIAVMARGTPAEAIDSLAVELLAEVDRLRAALQRVANYEWAYSDSNGGNCYCAKAAEHLLAGREPSDDPYC